TETGLGRRARDPGRGPSSGHADDVERLRIRAVPGVRVVDGEGDAGDVLAGDRTEVAELHERPGHAATAVGRTHLEVGRTRIVTRETGLGPRARCRADRGRVDDHRVYAVRVVQPRTVQAHPQRRAALDSSQRVVDAP